MSYYRIVGIFHEAEIFAIFMIKHQLAKICFHENFSSKMFLLTSRAQCLRVANPVNCQKVDLFCHRSIEQTVEIFHVLQSTRRNCECILGVSSLPLAWQFFTDSNRHALISVEILLSVLTLKMHAVGHHFHAGNCRGCSQTW